MSNQTDKLRAEMDMTPIWDGRNELNRLRGMIGALAYLTNPDRPKKDEDVTELFFETFADLQERLDKLACDFDTAINGMTFKKEATA